MILKYQIAFKLRPYGKEKSLFQIQQHATFNGQRLITSTGCQVNNLDAWDAENQCVKEGYKGPKGETTISINNTLRNCREQMVTAFRYFEANDINPTKKQVADKYQERIKGIVPKKPDPEPKKERNPKTSDFFEVYDKFVKESGEKNAWTTATYAKMETMRRDLKAFKKNLKFSDLTESTLAEFVAYFRDVKRLRTPRKKKGERDDYDHDDIIGLKNSSIEKKLRFLRWFLNWATENGYNTNMAYKSFKPTLKTTQKKVIYLTKEEMARVRNLQLSGAQAYLDPIRDVFLFCCFSGLRHSDANNLRRSDIKSGHIEVTTVKTADSISIELNDVTKAILEKYKDAPFNDNKALPNYTNQAMNRDVKELCRLAGINEEIRITTYKGNVRTDEIHPKWELVGTHTGRRTFIVNALSLGIPPSIVMKWTGHSDYSSMKPYIDIVDDIKATSMTQFNRLLEANN